MGFERLDTVEEKMAWSIEQRNERAELKSKLAVILKEEERAIRLKGKVSWENDGDGNSKLFQSLMSARKTKNAIRRIENEDDTLINEDALIVKRKFYFYSRLYSINPICPTEWDDIVWQPLSAYITEVKNDFLKVFS